MRFSTLPRYLVRICLLVAIVVGTLLVAGQPGVRAQESGLFSAAAAPAAPARPARSNALRSRFVRADLGQIAGLDGQQPAERLTLNLFDDVTFTAIRREATQAGPGRFSWVGDLEGVAEGEITLAVDGGVLAAGIQAGLDFYEVRWAGDQTYAINLLSRDDRRDGLEPLVPPASASALPPAAPSQSPTGETIDVLVLYTPKARTAAGGVPAMNALVDLAIADTNTAYANSNVAQRLRLVYKGEINYAESATADALENFSIDLNLLTDKAGPDDPGGVMDSAHTLRDNYHADLVALLADYSGGYCGLAWLMQSNSLSFESRGFSVINWDCAVAPQNSFAHELGHNMGLAHDKGNSGNSLPVFSYAYGYAVPGQFRTIMAYNCSPSCPRVRHFSNPNVLYAGQPTGTAANSASPAYNALALDNTANTVARFRTVPFIATDWAYIPRIKR
jgi:hypothetical protein